jgi:hypothetical protein
VGPTIIISAIFEFYSYFFEPVFGLKVNLAKSDLVPVGIVDNMSELAGILGCETSSLPLKYLGIPLGASYKAKSI